MAEKIDRLEIITKKGPNDIVTVSLKGIIDGYTYVQLEEVFNRLIQEQNYKFMVDLSQVDYMTSAGAGFFLSLLGIVQKDNGNIIFVKPNQAVRELFDLLGFTSVFTISDDTDDSLFPALI
jgi:anti-anti-sigma factor